MTLLIVSKLIGGGRGLAAALVRRAAVVSLDWDTRQKSRFETTDSAGRRVGVFLARGRIVRGGDVLVGEDGSLIAVRALDQPTLVVTAPANVSPVPGALAIAKAAYHLGNRHVPLEVHADRLVLEPDHVLAAMLERMGLAVTATQGPFEPEAGAYDTAAPARDHAHDHSCDHEHSHPGRSHQEHSPPDHGKHDHAHPHPPEDLR